MTHPPLDIEQRLSRLESSNRRLILAVGILSGLVGGLILLRAVDSRRSAGMAGAVPAASAAAMSAATGAATSAAIAPGTAGTLQVRALQLVDESGEVRAELRHTDEETGLFILDGEGTTRLGMAQFAHGGGGYALHGPEGRGAAVLYLKGDGSLRFFDAEGGVTARFPDASP